MINFENARKAFNEFLRDYDKRNKSIKLKVVHTYNVVSLSEYIAKNLGLDEENIRLAKVIALLHDIGRFEQVTATKKFEDGDNFDHANYGAKILFENNLIENFVRDKKYHKIIGKAVLNHNKYKIEDNLTEEELLHCKIIRDADKLDNFSLKEKSDFESVFPGISMSRLSTGYVSKNVYEDFMNEKLIKTKDRKTKLDYWVVVLAFIFDLNFDVSLKYVKEHDYINSIIDKLDVADEKAKEQVENMRKCANDYIDRKIIQGETENEKDECNIGL